MVTVRHGLQQNGMRVSAKGGMRVVCPFPPSALLDGWMRLAGASTSQMQL